MGPSVRLCSLTPYSRLLVQSTWVDYILKKTGGPDAELHWHPFGSEGSSNLHSTSLWVLCSMIHCAHQLVAKFVCQFLQFGIFSLKKLFQIEITRLDERTDTFKTQDR